MLLVWLFSSYAPGVTPEPPPVNPYLADSVNPLGHVTSAQQTAQAVAGPLRMKSRLDSDDVDYVHLGQLHFGAFISAPYRSGRRVIWSNGIGRVTKIDHESFAVLDSYSLPGGSDYSAEQADSEIDYYNILGV